MSQDKYPKKEELDLMQLFNADETEEDEKGEGGEGGQGTGSLGVPFRYKDALSIAPRDDLLPPSEIKRLLSIQKELHKARVDKQKLTRKEREALKENRNKGRLQSGAQRYSPYKKHPISDKAQFSGIDSQVIGIPSENEAETNLENQQELELRYQLRHQHQAAPRFNPKPRPY